jgi:hypothetical protein
MKDAFTFEIEHENLLDLRALAATRSAPGAPVSPGDVITEAVSGCLDRHRDELAEIATQAEQAEALRVATVHGGGAA